VLASLFGVNLAAGDPSSVRVLFNGIPATLLAVSATQINLQVPETAPVGIVEMAVVNRSGSSEPMLVRLERVSPGLFSALDASGAARSAVPADGALSLLATGLGPSNGGTLPTVQIVIGGMRLSPTRIEPFAAVPGTWRVDVEISQLALPASANVTLLVDGRTSNGLALTLAAR
jgi:uncharacterized protein (TIGR03437 family)